MVAHRGELLDQAADKLMETCGLSAALEKAECTALGSDSPVTVGSVQSLCRDERLARFPQDYFSEIVVDEAHHCLSDSYQKVLNHFPKAKVLGVSATIDRNDKKDLGQFFDSIAYEYLKDVAPGEVPLEQVSDAVKALALEEKQEEYYDEQISAMLEEANVRYYPERLQ